MNALNYKERWPNIKFNYEPKVDGKFCKGTGINKKDSFCICLFVQHDFCEEAGKMIGEYARKMRQELIGGNND